MKVWPNPWDAWTLPETISVEEVLQLLEEHMFQGGPRAQERWAPVVDALRGDPSLLLLWRLTSLRGGQAHPWDEALEALRGVPALVPGQMPEVQPSLVQDEERLAVLRDLLELPAMPPREMVKGGILGLVPEKKRGEE